MDWLKRSDVKHNRWLRAGYNILLFLVLVSSVAPALHWWELPYIERLFHIKNVVPIILISSAFLGLGLWLGQLRGFTRSTAVRQRPIWVLTITASGLGLGLAGFVAWLRWIATAGMGVDPLLISLTTGAALGLQALTWELTKVLPSSKPQASEEDETPAGSLRDYILLTKPIVLALLLVTTLAAMIVAAGGMPSLGLLTWTMIGGAFSAGGASALNQYIDRVRDGKMTRTKRRPLPEGRLQPQNVVIFGTLLCIAGFYSLAIFVNLISAILALAGMIYYLVLYSLMLKPTTTQNIVIGGGAGAIPPLVGWAAATGELSMPAFFLFALVFFWTPPHFWALALLKRRDYARAGVPMLPVVHGPHETRWQIMLYTLQVVALTFLLPLAQLGGHVYLMAAFLLGTGLLFNAWKLWRRGGNQPAYKMYRYSSTYLALIFAALVVDTFI
jgi:protoheme IX farnesyltransferase